MSVPNFRAGTVPLAAAARGHRVGLGIESDTRPRSGASLPCLGQSVTGRLRRESIGCVRCRPWCCNPFRNLQLFFSFSDGQRSLLNTLLEDVTYAARISLTSRTVWPLLGPPSSVVFCHGTRLKLFYNACKSPPTSRIDLFLDRLPEGKLLWQTPLDSGRVQPSRWHDYRTWTSRTTPCGETDKPRLPNPGTAQKAVVSSRTRPFASIWSRFQQAI